MLHVSSSQSNSLTSARQGDHRGQDGHHVGDQVNVRTQSNVVGEAKLH
jgi:hypothetical protein